MAEIHKIEKNGVTIYPATTTDAVVDGETRKTIKQDISLLKKRVIANKYVAMNSEGYDSCAGFILDAYIENPAPDTKYEIIAIIINNPDVGNAVYLGSYTDNPKSYSQLNTIKNMISGKEYVCNVAETNTVIHMWVDFESITQNYSYGSIYLTFSEYCYNSASYNIGNNLKNETDRNIAEINGNVSAINSSIVNLQTNIFLSGNKEDFLLNITEGAINQICGIDESNIPFRPLETAPTNSSYFKVENMGDTESPFKDLIGRMVVLTDFRTSNGAYYKWEQPSYANANRANRPKHIIFSLFVNEGDEYNQDAVSTFTIAFASETVKIYQPTNFIIYNVINSPIGVYREESFTSNMFNGNFKQIHAYKIDQWHQVVFEFYNLQWNIEENEKWMYGTYGGTIAHNRSSYRIINPIIVEDANIVYGLYTFTDACGVFKGNINNGVIGLKEQISTIEEKTDALSSEVDNIKGLIVGGTSKNTFEYNNSKDTISYITSPFDDDNNLELGVTIHRESKPFYVNGLFNFSSLNLVNKNDNRKTLVSIVQDDITPANFNRAYHGANHGNSDLRLCACQAHGKTFADIGSVWSNGDNNYTIVGIEDENNLYLLGDNTKTYPVFNMNRAPIGTYTHINGATNISSFTVTDSAVAQLKPATRLQDIRIYADDKLITENGKYEFSELKVCEIYDIKNVADILSRIKDSVGTYTSNPPFGELENIPSVARMSISYIFKSASQWFMAISFTALQNMEFHFFGFTQQQILSGSNIKLYIPKLLPINNGFSNVDFRTYIPLEVSSNIIATSEYWENPNLPPDRWIETNDNVAVHSGYLFDYGVGGDNRKDNISEALHLYTTKKMYPRGANTKIQLNEGNGIGAVVWRTYIPISKINKSGILCINSFEYGNGLYIYADFNKPGIYDINIDNRYIGKEVYVFENSGNVKLMTPISTSKIYIKVNTNEPMYGYIVMQIKP